MVQKSFQIEMLQFFYRSTISGKKHSKVDTEQKANEMQQVPSLNYKVHISHRK